MKTSEIKQLRNQVADGQTEQVLEYLMEHLDQFENKETHEEIIHLMARWKNHSRQKRMATLSDSDLSLEKRQIDYALLQLLAN